MNLCKSRIQRQFNRSALNYDAVAGMQREIVDELLGERVVEAKTAVDLGCGTGYGLARLAKLTQADLVGVDIAPAMLHCAASVCPAARFSLADIESLPFNDASFGLTLSCSALQWCELDQALAEIKRVTKPGGQILLTSFLSDTLAEWRRLWGLDDTRRFLSLTEFQAKIDQAGLSSARLWSKTYTQRFLSFHDAVSSVRDLGAGNAEAGTGKGLMGKRQLRAIQQQVEVLIDDQGYIELPYEVVFVRARKDRVGG